MACPTPLYYEPASIGPGGIEMGAPLRQVGGEGADVAGREELKWVHHHGPAYFAGRFNRTRRN